jgi:hypothetical protein
MTNGNKSYYSNDRRIHPQWGSETGVRGKENTRQVLLNELRNYRRITHNGFNFYLAIIDSKHPKFVRRTDRGYERWRMRFNVFASGFFSEWMPNTVLHHGELQVYYDLMPSRQKPWCLDFTFYYDDREIESQIMSDRYKMMDESFKDSLAGRDQVIKYLLFLPIDRKQFVDPDVCLDEFIDCQNEMMSRLESVKKMEEFRKNYEREESDEQNVGNKELSIEKLGSDEWHTSKNRRKRNVNRYQ